AMLQLLRDGRRRGVRDVRVVIDGSFRRIPKDVLANLRDEGVHVRTYHPFDLRHPSWMLHRMHEKVIVVDGKRYITGGRNLAESYFGRGRDINYRDLDIYVDGPSAADAERRFEQVWDSKDVYLRHCDKPILFLHGTQDEYGDVAKLEKLIPLVRNAESVIVT